MKVVAVISLAINAVLVLVIGFLFNKTIDSADTNAFRLGVSANSLVSNKTEEDALGDIVGEDDNKISYLALLECREESVSTRSDYYWESSYEPLEIEQILQKAKGTSIRNQLLHEYGSAAIDEPVFAEYFYPLGNGFEFLSLPQQLKVAEILGEAQGLKQAGDDVLRSAASRWDSEQSKIDSLASVLADSELLEYKLRDSELANRMRRTGFSWRESEFRQVFSVLDGDAAVRGARVGLLNSPWASVSYDFRIEEVLGRERYLEYLRSQDHMYSQIQESGLAANKSQDQIDRIFANYVDYQLQITSAMKEGRNDDAKQSSMLRDNYLLHELGITRTEQRNYIENASNRGFKPFR